MTQKDPRKILRGLAPCAQKKLLVDELCTYCKVADSLWLMAVLDDQTARINTRATLQFKGGTSLEWDMPTDIHDTTWHLPSALARTPWPHGTSLLGAAGFPFLDALQSEALLLASLLNGLTSKAEAPGMSLVDTWAQRLCTQVDLKSNDVK